MAPDQGRSSTAAAENVPLSRVEQAARTRNHILDAALTCIADEGLSRASSNEIARRAGISWGAIQHHFGSRAELMQALIDRSFSELVDEIEQVTVDGYTVLERLQVLADVIWTYCSDPRYVVSWMILIESRRDAEALELQIERADFFEGTTVRLWERLFGDVARDGDRTMFRLLFGSMRGFALNRHTAARPSDFVQERALLVRLLAAEMTDAA